MLYIEIEKFLAEEYWNCSLSKWIIDCGGDIVTKTIAFNLFCEIHFENFKKDYFKEIMKILENRVKEIMDSEPDLDIIDKTKYIFNTDFPYLWKTCKTTLDYKDKISTIRPIDDLKTDTIKSSRKGESFKRSSYQLLNRESIEEIIREYKESQKKIDSETSLNGDNQASVTSYL